MIHWLYSAVNIGSIQRHSMPILSNGNNGGFKTISISSYIGDGKSINLNWLEGCSCFEFGKGVVEEAAVAGDCGSAATAVIIRDGINDYDDMYVVAGCNFQKKTSSSLFI